jgi:hypothetical protein
MKKFAPLAILFSIVFLAGCIGQSGGGGGPGVVVTTFSASPSTAEPGTPVYIELHVENKGDTVANNVRAELMGLPQTEWNVPNRVQDLGQLLPPQPSRGMNQGGIGDAYWELTAPAGKNVDIQYEANVRLTYDYTSSLDAQVRAVTSEWMRQKDDKGGIKFQKSSSGPISISLIAPSTVISSGKIPIQFQITNTGSGGVTGEVLRFSFSSNVNCPRSEVRIPKGRTGALYCSINTAGVSNYENYQIGISTDYNYYIDQITSITVLRKPPV